MNEKNSIRAGVALVAVASIWSAYEYYKVVRKEEELKRRQIEAWERENLECIRKFNERMTELAKDPNVNAAEYWKEFLIENEFVKIMTNRPMC